MKKIVFFKLLLFAFSFTIGMAGVSAQHLYYPDRKNGDIIINEVMITNTTGCSYWETMGWNSGGQGGAYCGIQQGAKGPNFIFSIWDPMGTTDPITAPYKLPNSNVTKFGGEGTGLHYDDNATIGWKLNTWVRVVSRRWDYKGHSFFGYWSFDYGTNNWTHHVTMDFPVAGVKFNSGGTNSFLEDWCSSSQNYRKGLYKNGYKRTDTKSWIPFSSASYMGDGSSPSDAKANAGIENGSYFMEFGGSTVKNISEGQVFQLNIPATPVLTVGQLTSTSVSYQSDSLKVSWVTDKTKSPQFSYTIKLINSSGIVVLTKIDTIPHLRNVTLSVKNITSGNYTVRVSMTDIFDQQSNEIDKPISIGVTTGLNELTEKANDISVFPNPCNNSIRVFFKTATIREVTLFVYDITGRAVISNLVITDKEPIIDVSELSDGIYIVKVVDKNTSTCHQLKLIKASLRGD